MTFEEEEKVRKEGQDAFWKDKQPDDNPYPKNSEEAQWWDIGWLETYNWTFETYDYLP